jgi:hypothetical protein
MNPKNLRRTLARVERDAGHTPAMASHIIHKDCLDDPFIAMMVDIVLSSNSNQYERAEAMCRLLGSYGVGNIVTGRLV